jgi:hypothetical protein
MLMGSETEFGIYGGWNSFRAQAVQRCVGAANTHLPGIKGGLFLDNGARAYLDYCGQNEYCTPEVEDPATLALCELEGRRLMQEAARSAGEDLLCSNLDYGGSTWGTHENYECQFAPTKTTLAILLTHLATRIVYSGAGGPHPRLPGCCLVMSPRVAITHRDTNQQGIPLKSMVFHKSMHHGAPFRLHIICGESLLNPTASWLKYGATALVAHCMDRGLLERDGVILEDPLTTMHQVNEDLGLSSRHVLLGGVRATALDIQRRLAAAVASHHGDLPSWSDGVLNAWHEILDALERGDARLSGAIDWLLYWRSWLALASERGFQPEELSDLQRKAVNGFDRENPRMKLYEKFCMAARELHVRMHALGDNPVLAHQARMGWLESPIEEPAALRDETGATRSLTGRAENRRKVIRALQGREFKAHWNSIHDVTLNAIANIPTDDSWEGALRWEPAVFRHLPPSRPDDFRSLLASMANHSIPTDLTDSFRSGDYRFTISRFGPGVRDDHSVLALSHARLGNIDESLAALESSQFEDDFSRIAYRLFCAINFGLSPEPNLCRPLVESGELVRPETPDSYSLTIFDQSRGRLLLREGRTAEAVRLLRDNIETLREEWKPRMLARSCCSLAEGLRRSGDVDGAREQLMLATRIHRSENLVGDSIDYLFPVLVRLEEPDVAMEFLDAGIAANRRRENGLSLARLLCMQARIGRRTTGFNELVRLRTEVQALRTCALMDRILRNWSNWVDGPNSEDASDFWSL